MTVICRSKSGIARSSMAGSKMMFARVGAEPILNDAILKRVNVYWAKRGVGGIIASEAEECGILPFLR
jgi:hypothetical protein